MLVLFKIYNWNSKKIIDIDEDVRQGEKYIIRNSFGQFIAKAVKITNNKKKENDLEIGNEHNGQSKMNCGDFFEVIKKAEEGDQEKEKSLREGEGEVMKIAREKIKEYSLPMKLAGVNISLDNSSIVIAFTAENRVDFRELVRALSFRFQKAVRLEQIGSRDEAKSVGGFGPCGHELCCRKFNSCVRSINTDMARIQQITHRGNERISGCCGRLMCCLAYELDSYEEIMKIMPELNSQVKFEGKTGNVINQKILEKKVLVRFSETEEKWIDLNRVKKLNK